MSSTTSSSSPSSASPVPKPEEYAWTLENITRTLGPIEANKAVGKRIVTKNEWDPTKWLSFFNANKGNEKVVSALNKLVCAYTLRYFKYNISKDFTMKQGGKKLSVINMQNCKSTKYCTLPGEKRKPQHASTLVHVLNMDLLDALHFVKQTNPNSFVALHNMASRDKACKGWEKGYSGSDKAIASRSTFMMTIDPTFKSRTNLHPLEEYEAIFSSDVIVFRGSEKEGYRFLSQDEMFTVDIISVNGLDCKTKPFKDSDMIKLQGKIETVFTIAVQKNVDILVLGAFGCGHYKNPPERVAQVFREVIRLYAGHFTHIYFAILDSSSSEPALEPFARILTDNNSVHSSTGNREWANSYSTWGNPSTMRPRLIQDRKLCKEGGHCKKMNDPNHCKEYEHPSHCPNGPKCSNKDSVHRLLFVHDSRIWCDLTREKSVEHFAYKWATRNDIPNRLKTLRMPAPEFSVKNKDQNFSVPVQTFLLETQIAQFLTALNSKIDQHVKPAELQSSILTTKECGLDAGSIEQAKRQLTFWACADRFVPAYSGSGATFNPSEFFRITNKCIPTLIIVHTANGSIFGGYTNLNWNSAFGSATSDYGFLFSLRRANGRYEPAFFETTENAKVTIESDGSSGPIFGDHAIEICPNGSKNVKVRSEPYTNMNYAIPYHFNFLGGNDHENDIVMCEIFWVLNGYESGTVVSSLYGGVDDDDDSLPSPPSMPINDDDDDDGKQPKYDNPFKIPVINIPDTSITVPQKSNSTFCPSNSVISGRRSQIGITDGEPARANGTNTPSTSQIIGHTNKVDNPLCYPVLFPPTQVSGESPMGFPPTGESGSSFGYDCPFVYPIVPPPSMSRFVPPQDQEQPLNNINGNDGASPFNLPGFLPPPPSMSRFVPPQDQEQPLNNINGNDGNPFPGMIN